MRTLLPERGEPLVLRRRRRSCNGTVACARLRGASPASSKRHRHSGGEALPESNLGAYAADPSGSAPRRPFAANETGEIFLTDLVADARRDGKRVAVHLTDDPEEGIGVNTRAELANAEAALRKRIRDQHMAAGVTFRDPDSCQVDGDVRIAADVVIERGTILEGKTSIGSGSRVGPYAVLRDTTVGERCKVENSTLEGATLEDDVRIGPYSHLRPGAYLERGVEMGNFRGQNARLGPALSAHSATSSR